MDDIIDTTIINPMVLMMVDDYDDDSHGHDITVS